jgi:hypothetical protein
MERVRLDFMGPLPKTTRGDEYDGRSIYKVDGVYSTPIRQLRSLHKLQSTNCLHGLDIPFRYSQIRAESLRVPCLKLYVIYSKYIRLVQRLIDRPLMVRWKDKIEV